MKYDFDRIRREVPVSSVASRYVELVKGRSTCPLPDHKGDRKNTCFSVDEVKGWRCFSCATGGGSLKLVQVMESLSAVDAAKRIYEWYGLDGSPVPPREPEPLVQQVDNPPLKFELKDVDPSHAYLHNRGFEKELCEKFGVGYFPGKGSMAHRVVFPLHNPAGQLIGYCGRVIDNDLIGPECPRWLFPKGLVKNFLYNLHRVEGQFVVACESPWGVLQMAKADIPAVAILGKDATEKQVACLSRFKSVVLMLDGGTREQARALSAKVMSLDLDSLKVIMLPDGVQPDHLEPDELLALL